MRLPWRIKPRFRARRQEQSYMKMTPALTIGLLAHTYHDRQSEAMDANFRLSATGGYTWFTIYREANRALRAFILLLLDEGPSNRDIRAATLSSPTMIRSVEPNWEAGQWSAGS